MAASVSPLAAAELAAAATAAHPYCQRLWQQRQQLAPPQQAASIAQEAERRGLKLQPPTR